MRKITVYDNRDMTMSEETVKGVKEWLKFDAPNWCEEIHFDDRCLTCENDFRKVVYKDIFGSWGSPVEIR